MVAHSNCPGVAKMGGIGGPAKDAAKAYTPGPVGVMSRSGGMTTEISSTLTAAGLGQSTAVSIGGDAIIGSTYAELIPLFEADEDTEAIVIYMVLIMTPLSLNSSRRSSAQCCRCKPRTSPKRWPCSQPPAAASSLARLQSSVRGLHRYLAREGIETDDPTSRLRPPFVGEAGG